MLRAFGRMARSGARGGIFRSSKASPKTRTIHGDHMHARWGPVERFARAEAARTAKAGVDAAHLATRALRSSVHDQRNFGTKRAARLDTLGELHDMYMHMNLG